jgi:hypothetical protein
LSDPRPQIDLDSVRDDVAFRTTVLVELKYISKDLEELKVGLADHIDKDEQRFGKVHQQIGENSSSIAKGIGIFAALVVMVGVIMWLIDKGQP